MRSLFAVATIALASAAQWYGISPDDTVPGLINIFQMTPFGEVTKGTAAIRTGDREYVKSATFHCDWAVNSNCFFMTGVESDLVQDAVYAVNRATGATVWKHSLPAGIYSDNLNFDYVRGSLYYVAFDPRTRAANLVKINAATGALDYVFDISRDIRAGFIWGGDVAFCAQDGHIILGIDNGFVNDGTFADYLLRFDITGAQPALLDGKELVFPITASLHAVCNVSLFGTTVLADGQDRDKIMIVDYNASGPAFRDAAWYVPVVRANLPTFSQRGETPLFIGNLNAVFGGTVLIPFFPDFPRGPGPAPPLDFSLLWTVDPGSRTPGVITPLRYYLAGAAGVPQV